jgi:dihydrofolate reductase
MAELMVDLITSLDGYAGAEGWPGWWGLEGPEYLGWLEALPEKDRVVLMGATTYRLMSRMSAAAATEGQEEYRPEEAESLGGLDAMDKVVFSSTLTEPLALPNTRLVSTDAVEAVRTMKAEGTAPMSTLGSISLTRALLTAGLVDRFRLVVFPVITGRTGTDPVYRGYPDVALELVESRTFDGRSQLLEYVPTVLDGPPGAA